MVERFSASAASKLTACSASGNLPAAIPGWAPPEVADTKASSKGSDMHEILERAGAYSPKEMLGIAKAMAYVAALRQTRRFKQLIEEPAEGWWLDGKPNTRSDVVLYVADELHVIDYKFGIIPVDVQDNSQGKYYCLAYLPYAPKAKVVTFHIVQPFADNIESVVFTMDELEQYRLDTIAAQGRILRGDLTFSPGDHCQFCSANPHSRGAKSGPYCPALMKLYYPPALVDEDAILAMD